MKIASNSVPSVQETYAFSGFHDLQCEERAKLVATRGRGAKAIELISGHFNTFVLLGNYIPTSPKVIAEKIKAKVRSVTA